MAVCRLKCEAVSGGNGAFDITTVAVSDLQEKFLQKIIVNKIEIGTRGSGA